MISKVGSCAIKWRTRSPLRVVSHSISTAHIDLFYTCKVPYILTSLQYPKG